MKSMFDNVKKILADDFVYMHHEDFDFVPPVPADKAAAEVLLENSYYCVNCEYESMTPDECAIGPKIDMGYMLAQ